jgi:DNA uptake protein ComE-like DNA-binding protein
MWKKLKRYLSFSRREQRGIAVLLILTGLFAVAGLVEFPRKETPVVPLDQYLTTIDAQINNKKNDRPGKRAESYIPKTGPQSSELFEFDPNTISEADWLRLGISGKTASAIRKYLQAGGKFKKPEDLAKIYTLSESDYQRIAPYIRISGESSGPLKKDSVSRDSRYTKKAIPMVELNSADSTLLIELPGIGGVFAARIIKYRNRLGGFVSTDQLSEVYGMDQQRLQAIRPYISIDTTHLVKIDINQASFKELLRHPYLEYYLVKAIADYRQKNKGFRDIRELRNIGLFYDELYAKIRPYLTVQPTPITL